jgi:hypothetical protein
MMPLETELRTLIRQILHEISVTGGGEAYNTPLAFSGNKKKNVKRKANIAQKAGWKLTSRGAADLHRGADKLREHTNYE